MFCIDDSIKSNLKLNTFDALFVSYTSLKCKFVSKISSISFDSNLPDVTADLIRSVFSDKTYLYLINESAIVLEN